MLVRAVPRMEVGTIVDRIYDDLLAGARLEPSLGSMRTALSASLAVLNIDMPGHRRDESSQQNG